LPFWPPPVLSLQTRRLIPCQILRCGDYLNSHITARDNLSRLFWFTGKKIIDRSEVLRHSKKRRHCARQGDTLKITITYNEAGDKFVVELPDGTFSEILAADELDTTITGEDGSMFLVKGQHDGTVYELVPVDDVEVVKGDLAEMENEEDDTQEPE
jgi:hypothetical protein